MAVHVKNPKPTFNYLITTGDRYDKDLKTGGVLMQMAGHLKLYQKVIAVGSCVRDIKVGDTVMINPTNYAVKRYSKDSIQNDIDNNPILKYDFNWITIDDENGDSKDCLFLNDRDILYTCEVVEEDDNIILPDKPNIILN